MGRLEWELQCRAEAAACSPAPSLKRGSPLSSGILAFLLGLGDTFHTGPVDREQMASLQMTTQRFRGVKGIPGPHSWFGPGENLGPPACCGLCGGLTGQRSGSKAPSSTQLRAPDRPWWCADGALVHTFCLSACEPGEVRLPDLCPRVIHSREPSQPTRGHGHL